MSKVGEYSRDNTIEALIKHAEGHIPKHAMNVEIFLKNAPGVGEHPDVLESTEKELKVIAEYDDPNRNAPKSISQVHKKLDKNPNNVYTVKYILRGDIPFITPEK